MDKVATVPGGYDFGADYYGEMETPVQKVAEAPAEEEIPTAHISPLIVKQRMERAHEKLAMEKKEHEFEWLEALEKAAKLFVVASVPPQACVPLEKDAVSTLGCDIIPELTVLKEMTGRCKQALLGGENVADIAERHVANPTTETRSIIQMLKVAQDARTQMVVCKQGLEWLATNLPRVK